MWVPAVKVLGNPQKSYNDLNRSLKTAGKVGRYGCNLAPFPGEPGTPHRVPSGCGYAGFHMEPLALELICPAEHSSQRS